MNPIHLVPKFNKESTMHTLQMTAVGISVSLLLISGASAAEKTKVKGAVEQSAQIESSPITSIAVGVRSKTSVQLNSLGNADIGGPVKQQLVLKKAPITAAAIGAGSSAEIRINAVGAP